MKHPYHKFNTGRDILDESLENYVMHGLQPGGFLTAVIANDLFRAVSRADHWSQKDLYKIAFEVSLHMPVHGCGSYDAVRDWIADKDGRRSHYVEHLKKQRMMDILSGDYVPVETNKPVYGDNMI